MRKTVFTLLVTISLSASPSIGKDSDITACVIPVRTTVTANPPRLGEFWTHSAYGRRDPRFANLYLDGYLGVPCDFPTAQKVTFHHSFVSGWNPVNSPELKNEDVPKPQ